jgi:hypothetical protein
VGCTTTCLLLDCCGGKPTLGSFMIKRKHSKEKITVARKLNLIYSSTVSKKKNRINPNPNHTHNKILM